MADRGTTMGVSSLIDLLAETRGEDLARRWEELTTGGVLVEKLLTFRLNADDDWTDLNNRIAQLEDGCLVYATDDSEEKERIGTQGIIARRLLWCAQEAATYGDFYRNNVNAESFA